MLKDKVTFLVSIKLIIKVDILPNIRQLTAFSNEMYLDVIKWCLRRDLNTRPTV